MNRFCVLVPICLCAKCLFRVRIIRGEVAGGGSGYLTASWRLTANPQQTPNEGGKRPNRQHL